MNNNFTVITFPGLGLRLDPGRAWQIGPLAIHYYGLLIALGLVLALIYAWKRANQFGLREDDLTDGVLWVTPFAVLCARAYYCVFEWERFASNPISVLYIWNGGLAIYGGVIGAVIGVLVFCRIRKIKAGAVLDMVALGFLIGQCIGRWGNFFNREAFGAETDWFLRMGLLDSVTGETTYHHPTFLYESVWNLAGFVLLHFLSKKRRYDGQVALGYAAWYGLGRTLIEGLRTDSLWWGPLRVSQILAAVSCFAAVVVLLINMFREFDPATLFVNQVAARKAEEALTAAEEAEETAEAPATEDAAEEETEEEDADNELEEVPAEVPAEAAAEEAAEEPETEE